MTYRIAALVSLMVAAPAVAQDVYDTEQLSRHAEVERHRQLLRSTVGRDRSGPERHVPATPAQRQACANKARFRAQHGANEPRVRYLYQRCQALGL